MSVSAGGPSMTLDEAENLLNVSFAAVRQPNFRNDYEAKNAYELNLERIASVRAALAGFSGARIEGMIHRCDDIERDWNKRHHNQPKQTQSTAMAFGGEWIKELQAEDEVDEMEDLTTQAAVKRKQKSKGKRHKGPGGGLDLTDGQESQRDTKNEKLGMVRGSSLCHMIHPNSTDELPTDVLADVDTVEPRYAEFQLHVGEDHYSRRLPKQHHPHKDEDDDENGQSSPLEGKTVETHAHSMTSAIPQEVVDGSKVCRVVPMQSTAFAELQFDKEMSIPAYEGGQVVYHVQMYRAVIAAIARGPPKETAPTTAPRLVSPSKAGMPALPRPVSPAAAHEEDCEECVISSESDEETNEERRNSRVWKKMGSEEFEVLQDLSSQVVSEYDQKAEEEDAEFNAKEFPTSIAAPLAFLRHVSTSTWVILMCHGGYFAGAVYANTKPVLHKSFHRYVVRKKQGGKQSSHDKGGGSGGSAGGQIRRGQEIKWKVAVRDLLIAWREHIDRAWVIMYAAPGPDNRAILTDFTLLPASTSNGVRESSPISLKDPRVRSIPMTTHRPTFNEVERVFEAVSKCTIRIKHATPELEK